MTRNSRRRKLPKRCDAKFLPSRAAKEEIHIGIYRSLELPRRDFFAISWNFFQFLAHGAAAPKFHLSPIRDRVANFLQFLLQKMALGQEFRVTAKLPKRCDAKFLPSRAAKQEFHIGPKICHDAIFFCNFLEFLPISCPRRGRAKISSIDLVSSFYRPGREFLAISSAKGGPLTRNSRHRKLPKRCDAKFLPTRPNKNFISVLKFATTRFFCNFLEFLAISCPRRGGRAKISSISYQASIDRVANFLQILLQKAAL